jgi:decaprenylphospho-beta-D-erythro-pentofuranosid-2-ulose 2-reductase
MTIEPGFVDTPMAKDFKKGVLWAQPDDTATGFTEGIEKKRDNLYLL